jgi:hypothetical protein
MQRTEVLLIAFIVLTILFASISTYEYASPNQASSSTQSISSSSSIPSFQVTQSTSPSLLGASGQLVIQGVGPFDYLQRNSSTPDQFSFDYVKFSVWTNTTVTITGGTCYGSGNYYGGYVATFSDGSSETFTACLSGPYPYVQILLTKHQGPQAGLLISGVNHDVYFLVRAITQ